MFQECHSSNSNFKTYLIREKRKIWALENDVDLLNQLEAFSQRLVDRTHGLLNHIQEFEKDLKVTRIEVKTLSNNFEAVADNQFVENRVFDEEEDLTSFQREQEELPLYSDKNGDLEAALMKCANILENKFEAVNIPLSDSEDDADVGSHSETVLLPKNRYKLRPLPHLIGGEDFYKDDSLGLLGIYDRNESLNDNIMNGDDETITQSESSSIDEPDESSVAQDYSANKYDNEANSLSDKDNFDSLFNNQTENLWKDNNLNKSNDYQPRRGSNSSNHPDSIAEKKIDTNSISEKSNSDLSLENNQPQTKPGGNLMSSMHDELKQLFAGDVGEKKSKLKVFEKTYEPDQKPSDKTIFPDKVPDNSIGTSKLIESRTKPVISPKHNLIHKSVEGINSPENTESYQKVASIKSFEEIHVPKIEGKQLNKQILKDDNILPHVQTEILPSFAKERAKFKGKRRLPSRKSKSIENEVNESAKKEIKENPVLSPSTDEEDLFLLPQTQISKESPASSLFTRPSLFSPGSSIEESNKSFLTEDLDEKLITTNKEASNIFDEPLGVHKAMSTEIKSDRSKQLFKDWDPFDSDDGELFPSLEKGHKSKLFDNLKDSPSKSTPSNEDDIFFEKSSASGSKLFENTSMTFGSNKKLDKSKLISPKLFSDDSDDESGDLFFDHSSFKTPFLSSENSSLPSARKTGSLFNEPEKSIRREVHSNPLSDPDDNLFD